MRKFYLGPVSRKVLLLIVGGVALGLSGRPDAYFKILRGITDEWKKINERSAHRAIKLLWDYKILKHERQKDGTMLLMVSDKGKKLAFKYNEESVQIQKQKKWDGVWRIVMFDIPEKNNVARKALVSRLKLLGFYPLQKSVFIFPYECEKEIMYLAELFRVRRHVRFVRSSGIGDEAELKENFEL